MKKPLETGNRHVLPFAELSPAAFERLCLWLLREEGFGEVQHIGAAGADKGCDLAALHQGQRWLCQCKRVRRFGPKAAMEEFAKIHQYPLNETPHVILIIVTADVSLRVRTLAQDKALPARCVFWGLSELDERVKRHDRIVAEFFDTLTSGTTAVVPADEYGFPVPDYLQAIEALASKQRVDEYWVPLAARIEGRNAAETDAETYIRAWVSRDSSRLAILGDYGTGKTWLCIRLARHLAAGYGTDPTSGPLPLLLDLRSYRDGMTFAELLPEAMYRSYGIVGCNAFRMISAIDDGRVVLLLDGLDEMAREIGVRSALVQFERLGLPDNGKTVVTCRTHYFLSGNELREILQPGVEGLVPEGRRFEVLHLRLMDRSRITEAITRRAPSHQGDALVRFAESTYDLRGLCSRPVLLALVCESYGGLSSLSGKVSAADLYESYLSAWLRRELRSGRIDIDPTAVMDFLEGLAEFLFPVDSVWLSGAEFRRHVDAFAKRLGLLDASVDSLVRKLATSTILTRSFGDGWSFAHRSFQEYLYARRFFSWEEATGGAGDFPVTRVPAWQFVAQLALRRWTISKAEKWIVLRVPRQNDPSLCMTTLRAAAAYWLAHSKAVRVREYELSGIMLDSVDLRNVDFSNATMEGADLHRSDLRGARLNGTNLRRANLREVNFSGVDLTGADLQDSDCRGACFDGAVGASSALAGAVPESLWARMRAGRL